MIHLVEIGCYVGATSGSVQTVGLGVKSFVISAGPAATVGMTLRIEKTGDPAIWMEGLVIGATPSVCTIAVKAVAGSGVHAAWTLAAGQLRFSTDEYDHPTGPGPYEPVIAADGYAQGSVSLHGDGRSFGAADREMGLIKIINVGARDHLRRYAYFGRLARELVIGGPEAAYGTATVLRTGTIEQPVVSSVDVLFRWRGKLSDLDSRWQPSTYPGGTGAGMSTDGADALKDLPRPRLRGYRAQIEPVPTNVAGNLRQISDRRIHGVSDGRNRGVPIATGVKHASLAALKAATPTGATFDWYDGADGDGAWCKTAFSSQGGVFTLAAWEGATEADRSIAQVWRRIMIDDCGYTAADISAPDVAALDAACPWEAGVWAGAQERTKKDVLDELCGGVAGYHDDDLGQWRVVYDGAAAGEPVLTFLQLLDNGGDARPGQVPYVSLELVASNDDTRGLPVCAVDVAFSPRDRALGASDLAGDAAASTDPVGGADVRKQLSGDGLSATWPPGGKDAAIVALWGERRLSIRTALRKREHALALAQRLFAVHAAPWDRFRLTAFVTAETVVARPGLDIAVQSSRYGLHGGATLRVNGRTLDGQTMTLDVLETPS